MEFQIEDIAQYNFIKPIVIRKEADNDNIIR